MVDQARRPGWAKRTTLALVVVALCGCQRSGASPSAAGSGTSAVGSSPDAADSRVPNSEPPEDGMDEGVPANLGEAHRRLLQELPPQTIEEMRAGTEVEMVRYHHGPGTWIRNEWGLWRGSRLARYFNAMGVHHPDDMSGIILETLWCRLHDQPFRLQERVAEFAEYWASVEEPKEGSPKDGAKIVWCIQLGGGKGAVHLGVSVSDSSYWRYEYRSGRGVEPARPEEHAQLDELRRQWRLEGIAPAGLEALFRRSAFVAPRDAGELED